MNSPADQNAVPDNALKMKCGCRGWVVVCPDGKVRSYPAHNRADAVSEAKALTACRDCRQERREPKQWGNPPCPQGSHTVRRQK